VVAGVTSNFLTDALGSPVAVTDASGTAQTEYTYEPFGKTTVTGAANTNPFQYTGRENDGTSLYYYRARYYNPALQRFISEDPIGFDSGDFNLYAYVNDNPIIFKDPTGKAPVIMVTEYVTIGQPNALIGEQECAKLLLSDTARGCLYTVICGRLAGFINVSKRDIEQACNKQCTKCPQSPQVFLLEVNRKARVNISCSDV